MTAAEAFETMFAFRNERYVKDLNFTVTASMFVWRSVFDAVGGFENAPPGDKEWGMRAGRQGFRIGFAAKSFVGHPARRTMPELNRKWRRLMLELHEGAEREGWGPVRVLARQWTALLAVVPPLFRTADLETCERDSKLSRGDRGAWLKFGPTALSWRTDRSFSRRTSYPECWPTSRSRLSLWGLGTPTI